MWYVYSFFSLSKGFFIAKLPSISLPKLFPKDRNRYFFFFFFFSSSLLKSFEQHLNNSESRVSINLSTLVWAKGTQPDFQRWQGGGAGWHRKCSQRSWATVTTGFRICEQAKPEQWCHFWLSLFTPFFSLPSLPQKETGPVLKSFTILKRFV